MIEKEKLFLSVEIAKFNLDTKELSRLGKKGAEVRKARKLARLTLYLNGSKEMSEQAHEEICPVDD